MRTLPDSLAPAAAFLARHSALVALALLAAVGLAVLDDYGVSGDDGPQRIIGYASLDYILGDEDALTEEFTDGRYIERFYGVAFEVPLVAVERVLGLEDSRDIYLSRHLITHLFFLVGGFFCWLLAYRLFGSRLVALLAMLLFLLHPRVYAHSFFNTKDIPFLSMFMVALYLTHRAFRRDSVWAFALCGVGVGLLADIRIIGVMLFPAVLGMLVWDAIRAAIRDGWIGTKRALANAGAFSLASAATFYAAWPALWRDPLFAIEAFETLSSHPIHVATLFRGEAVRWPNLLWDYIPTWMLITTPPVALALAAVGIGHLARLCAARWRDMFANSTARFGLLTAACLTLPVVAAILLNSNLYHDWRQMYFLYAPLCVLAAFGLRELAALPKPSFRAATLALAAVGLSVAVVQSARLHPHQTVYFNSLVNRGEVASQYEIGYADISVKEALDRMLSMHPRGRVSVNDAYALDRNLQLIPLEERQRTSINRYAPDFYIDRTAENPAWTREVYGAPIVSLVDNRDAARAAYRRAYAAAQRLQADFRAHFDVYAAAGLLIYIKEPCAEADTLGTFTVSARPVHPDAVSDYMRDDGFADKKFRFWDYGKILGDACVMALRTPAYPLESLNVAYYPANKERDAWSVDIPMNGHLAAYNAAQDSELLVRTSGFDIYRDGDTLAFMKEDCGEEDTRGRFLLSIFPVDRSDLSKRPRDAGLEHEPLNFDFWQRGAVFDGKCVIPLPLPNYPISHIETGQWMKGEDGLWSARILFDGFYERYRRALSALSGEPDARSDFDIWLNDSTLIYVKEGCGEEDALARFSLSAFPVDRNDLPQSARDAGLDHEPLNFDFAEYGAIFDGKCAVIRDLPDYPISHIETGQWTAGEGGLWSARIILDGFHERYRRALASLSGDPAIRSDFDVYMEDGALIYVKSPCAEGDTRGRFALSVYPADSSDLPKRARDAGLEHEPLNFDFAEYGAVFDGKCAIIRRLPSYPIGSIETGQWIPGEGELWRGRVSVGD